MTRTSCLATALAAWLLASAANADGPTFDTRPVATDTFTVDHVQLWDRHWLQRLDTRSADERADDRERFGWQVHRLVAGEGVAIGWRRFDPGTDAIDDEIFHKLTIWLATRPTTPVTIDLADAGDDVVAFHSEGGSAWPNGACSGVVDNGTLSLTPAGDGFAVVIEARTTPAGNRGVRPHCDAPIPVRLEFTAQALTFDALTPWLGRAGEHPYAETYR